MAIQFKGFSTVDLQSRRGWTLYDVDLIKRDLLNIFNTRKGERLMMPEYGTIIWDMLFEPFSDENKQAIINTEPRVTLTSIDVSTSDYGIMVGLELNYTPWNSYGTFAIDFDRRSVDRTY